MAFKHEYGSSEPAQSIKHVLELDPNQPKM